MKDRNNPTQIQEAVPAGLSQMSHLPSQGDCDSCSQDWMYGVEELSDTEDYSHSRKVISHHYNEVT
jgi:hypothetical protein